MAETIDSEMVLDDPNLRSHEVDEKFVELAREFKSHDVLLTESEQRLLVLFDQMSELQLESALLIESQKHFEPDVDVDLTEEELQEQLKSAERDCLEARALYLLKNKIVENVLVADPVLKAVHSGPNADYAERKLHPLVDHRDVLSIAHTNLSASLKSVMMTYTTTESQNIIALQKNRKLAAHLLELVQQLKAEDLSGIDSTELQSQLNALRASSKESKRRWRIMKSLIAALVAGSGVDWTQDSNLRDLVLDDED